MAWSYLWTEEFDKRAKIVAELLKGKTKGQFIIDLDCGIVSVGRYLEKDWANYYGNDLNYEYIELSKHFNLPNSEFDNIPDHLVEPKVCDILICLGEGAGKFTGVPLESYTIFDKIHSIIHNCVPSYVIIESIREFEDKFKLLTKHKEFLEERGYVTQIIPCQIEGIELKDLNYVKDRLILFAKYAPNPSKISDSKSL